MAEIVGFEPTLKVLESNLIMHKYKLFELKLI